MWRALLTQPTASCSTMAALHKSLLRLLDVPWHESVMQCWQTTQVFHMASFQSGLLPRQELGCCHSRLSFMQCLHTLWITVCCLITRMTTCLMTDCMLLSSQILLFQYSQSRNHPHVCLPMSADAIKYKAYIIGRSHKYMQICCVDMTNCWSVDLCFVQVRHTS